MVTTNPSDAGPAEEVRQPRRRSRHAGLIADYATKKGTRWKYQLYVPIDPARLELGEKRATRGGFETMKQAQAALDKALKARAQHAKLVADMPTIAEYAELWVSGLRLEASTIHGYRKIIRNQVTPQLGTVTLDKITATRLAAHYRELERCGRADGKGLSPNTVHKVHVLIGAMLSTAVEEGLIAVNPAKLRRTVNAPTSSEVRAAKPEIRVWTGQQLAAFLAWDRDTIQDEFHPGAPGPLHHHHHDEHLQPCRTDDAEAGREPLRRPRRQRIERRVRSRIRHRAARLAHGLAHGTGNGPSQDSKVLIRAASTLCARGDLNPHVLSDTGT